MTDMSTDTVTKEEVKTARPPMAEVHGLNDDYTDVNFVIAVLMQVFRKSIEEAAKITSEIHHNGRSRVGVFPMEVAEMKVQQAHSMARANGFPLAFDVIPTSGDQT